VSLSPTNVTFGCQALACSTGPQTVTLTNTGNATLSITSLAVTGTNAGDFVQTNSCGTSVAAGAGCTIKVTFTPSGTGSRTASLTLADNLSGTPPTVSLSGSGMSTASTVTLSSTSLAFGNQPTQVTSTPQTVTLTNTGNATLSITSLAVTGTNASDFVQTNSCGSSVAAGANCTISITFTPAASGARTATLSIADNASGSPQDVVLSGTGTSTSAGVSLSSTSLVFGSQPTQTTSAPQTVTLTNAGGATLSVTSLAVTGTNPGDFAQTNSCGSSVAAGANCTISITFTPSATGARTATLSIADNASGSPQTVSLSGTGTSTSAGVSLSSTSLVFGSQPTQTTSAPQTVTLTNTGNATLSVTSLAVTGTNPGDFAQTNTCGSSVLAGANCTISITFKPSATGARTATLSIADNASGSPQAVSLSGTGTSTSAGVSLSSISLVFGSQPTQTSSAPQTVTLTNTGNATLSVTSLAVTGTNPGDFSQTNTCGSSVLAGANCTISITFKPPATGARTATLSIADNASGSPQTVSLSGTGTSSAPTVSLSSTSLAFGKQPATLTSAPQSVTLTNTGAATLSITSLTITGANAGDFSQNSTCGGSVLAGDNCTIAVLFTPSAAGARTAALSILDTAGGSPQTVSLSGTGSHDVILSWTTSSNSGDIGYYVYRGTTSGGESSTPVNSTPINDALFTDESVTAGTTYYYVVTAVASDGITQSLPSSETVATIPSP
jgi:hypothetical protein